MVGNVYYIFLVLSCFEDNFLFLNENYGLNRSGTCEVFFVNEIMSYYKSCDGGIYIEQNKYIKEVYCGIFGSSTSDGGCCSVQFHSHLFALENPYIKESDRKRKKRKRKHEITKGETHAIQVHNLFKDRLECSFKTLSTVVAETPKCVLNTNCMKQAVDEVSLFQTQKIHHFQSEKNPDMVSNENCYPILTKYEDKPVLLPQNCSFLQSDVAQLSSLVEHCKQRKKFSCVLLDPPWRNKSVKRGSKYSWLDFHQIKDMPVPALISNSGIVAVWVTNKTTIMEFVTNELFPHWKVQVLGKWFWLKVTTKGELIFPLNSLHKKPYEMLVIGQVCNNPQSPSPSMAFSEKIFCSVPCKIHSHKPPIYKWLEELVWQKNPCFLEMFARNLTPNWTSWGNEVLMLQDINYYEVV